MINFDDIINSYPINLQSFKRNIFREYLQYKILAVIFTSNYGSKLSFLGGTALRIIHNNNRFSEDLDFDNFSLTPEDFENITSIVKRSLETEGFDVEFRNVYKGAYRCYLRLPRVLFEQGLSPFKEEKILIQIDTVSHSFNYIPNTVIINKFEVFSPIKTTPIDILLSQKIYAVFNRKAAKGRDFYDIVFLLSKTKPNLEYLKLKINIDNFKQLKERFLEKINDLDFDDLAKDIKPFLFNPLDSQKVEIFKQYIEQISFE